MSKEPRAQTELFAQEVDGRASARVQPAPASDELRALRDALPAEVRLGTSSWSFPGWAGLVYDRQYPARRLAQEGLGALTQHPLVRAVGLDRSYHAALPLETYERYASETPEDIRFLVKAHVDCTVPVFPRDARYGSRRGRVNDRFLAPGYAAAAVVEPARRGLGPRLGPILFQFTPALDVRALGGARGFFSRLGAFLARLPSGPRYAVELRDAALLSPAYREMLHEVGACHCVNVYPGMPDPMTQYERTRSAYAPALIVRWMLRDSLNYAQATAAYAPFDRLVDPAPRAREAIVALAQRGRAAHQPVYVIVNNKAEGSAPRSLVLLARSLATRR